MIQLGKRRGMDRWKKMMDLLRDLLRDRF